ncbi:outer membrane protein A-like [Ptychodera flava]|uniref:outer membrane protein A-like n=1 Tax=Ptychodera flava TaxID=63121 RepID=UPI00396A2361
MFRTYQRIPTNGAIDWEYFNIGFEHYLIVANLYGGNSAIYKWDGLNFVEFQVITNPSPACWHAIPVGSCRKEVLLVEGTHRAILDNIQIYHYKVEAKEFVKVDDNVDTDGGHCRGLTSFRMDDGYVYLAKTNINGGNQNYIDKLDVKLEKVDNPVVEDYAQLQEELAALKENLTQYESDVAMAQASIDDAVTLDGNQTIAGAKNFTTNVTISGTLFGNSITVEGDIDVDAGQQTVDIGSQISTSQLLAELQRHENSLASLEATLDDAVTLDSPQDVSGTKIFKNLTVENTVQTQTLQVVFVNDVDLEALDTDAVRLDDDYIVYGVKTFSQDVTITGDVVMKDSNFVNGIDLSEEAVYTNTVRNISGTKTFNGGITIQGDAIMADSVTVDGVDISAEAIILSESYNITGNKTFNSASITGSVSVSGLVDGVDISDLFADTLLVSGPQTITGAKNFTQSVSVDGDITVDGSVNGADLSNIDAQAAKLGDDFEITGHSTFQNNIIIRGNLTVGGTIDEIDISDVVTLTGSQEITGPKTFTSLLTVTGDIVVDGNVDGIDLSEHVVTLSGPQNISDTQIFSGGIETHGNVAVMGTVDGIDISTLEGELVTCSTDQTIPFDTTFADDVTIKGALSTAGSFNGLDLSGVFNDAVIQNSTQDQVITGRKTFQANITIPTGQGFINVEGPLNTLNYFSDLLQLSGNQTILGAKIFRDGFEVNGNLQVDGSVDGVDLDTLDSQLVDITAPESIAGTKTFNGDVTVNGNIVTTGTTNGIDLSEELMMVNQQQNVTGAKSFSSVELNNNLTVHGDVTVTGYVDGVNLVDFDSKRITLSTDQVIGGDLTFSDDVRVNGNVTVDGTVNDLQLPEFANTVMSATKDQIITATKNFTSTVNVVGDVIAASTVDGVDLSQLETEAMYTDGDQTITGRKEFAHHVKVMNDLNVNGTIDGVDVEFIDTDAVCNSGPQVITANKTFTNGFSVTGDIVVNGEVNSIDISQEVFRKSQNQNVTGMYTFQDVNVTGSVTLTGEVNGVDIAELQREAVLTDVQQIISADIIFVNDIHVETSLNITGTLNGIDVGDLYFNTPMLDEDSVVESNHVIFAGSLVINGNLNLTDFVNMDDLSELFKDVVFLHTDQDITETKTFTENVVVVSDMIVSSNMTVHGIVDGVHFESVLEDAVYLDSSVPQNITGKKIFANDIHVNGDIIIDGKVDGFDLSEEAVTLNGNEEIPGLKTFNNDVQMNANMVVTGNINGIDITAVEGDLLQTSGNQIIVGNKTFMNDIKMQGDLFVDGTVDGVNLNEEACTLGTPQFITAVKRFKNITYVHGSLKITGVIEGLDIDTLSADRVTLSGSETLNGLITFNDTVTINGDLRVESTVDGVHLQELKISQDEMTRLLRYDLVELTTLADQQCDLVDDMSEFYHDTIAYFNYLENSETLSIQEPRHVEAFKFNGTIYLATTSYMSTIGSSTCVRSKIYGWDDSKGKFTSKWELGTNAATRWHAFTMNEEHYLVIANKETRGCDTAEAGKVFKYNGNSETFDEYQNIETLEALDAGTADIDGTTYLAIANTKSRSGGVESVTGFVYRFNESNKFELHQELSVGIASGVEFVKVDDQHFLVFSKFDTGEMVSPIYKFDPEDETFTWYQNIDTNGAKDVTSFMFEHVPTIVIADEQKVDSGGSTSYEVAVTLYQWSDNSKKFDWYDKIDMTAPSAVEAVRIGSYYYLGVVSAIEEQFTLYKYYGSTGWLEAVKIADITGLYGLEIFERDGETYILLVADPTTTIYHAVRLGGSVNHIPDFCKHDLLEGNWHGPDTDTIS